jgi:hypothetical protein
MQEAVLDGKKAIERLVVVPARHAQDEFRLIRPTNQKQKEL